MNCSRNKHTKRDIVIAIDGFSSCGKSTFAKAIASEWGYIFIDTGAMYRALTLYAIENGAIEDGSVNAAKLVSLLDSIDVRFQYNNERGASDVILNGVNVESEIRSIAVSDLVSDVSRIGAVREKLVNLQQEMGRCKGVVMDGRDIGTVVFPNAELKIFMTAAMDIRAQRRYDELKMKGLNVPLEDIVRNIEERDFADQHRKIAPLRKADDAIILDNSHMTLEEQIEWIKPLLEERGVI